MFTSQIFPSSSIWFSIRPKDVHVPQLFCGWKDRDTELFDSSSSGSRATPFEAMWKSRCIRCRLQVVIVVVFMLRLISQGPNLVSQHAFSSKASRTWPTSPMSRVDCKQSSESRVFHKPSNPKWTWPLSLVILTFSLSASKVQPPRLSSSKVGLARQAFAGGLEGCDHHGAGRYEFEARRFDAFKIIQMLISWWFVKHVFFECLKQVEPGRTMRDVLWICVFTFFCSAPYVCSYRCVFVVFLYVFVYIYILKLY